MTQGIKGFMEYTKQLVDRDRRVMALANAELSKRLSHTDLLKLEMVSLGCRLLYQTSKINTGIG